MVPLHKLLMAAVAAVITKNTQRNTLMHFISLPFKKASTSKCSSLRAEHLGFKMSLPMLKSMLGTSANRSTNCGLKV